MKNGSTWVVVVVATLLCGAQIPEDCSNLAISLSSPPIQAACVGAASAQFEANVSGVIVASYQWRRGTTVLVDGPKYSGARTSTLTVSDISAGDAGDNYNCVATCGDNTVTSENATLVVNVCTAADLDQNCTVGRSDVDVFRACLTGATVEYDASNLPDGCELASDREGRIAADLDRDGDVDMDDFGLFQRAYGEPAPVATAPAIDVVFVVDLSNSLSFDSELFHYRLREIVNRPVWAYLWDTLAGTQPIENGKPAGPSLGNMNTWGADATGPDWDYAHDAGLVRLKRGANWVDADGVTAAFINQTMIAKGYTPYTTAQISTIRTANKAGTETSSTDSTQKANYRRRVRVALGIDRWIPSYLSDTMIDAGEVENMVPYPSSDSNPDTNSKQVGGGWDAFIDYVSDIGSSDTITSDTGLSQKFLKYDPASGLYGNPGLRWRFGLKTWIDYVLECNPGASRSPGLGGAPVQPMATIADGVKTMIATLRDLQGNDQLGLAGFDTLGYGPVEKPGSMSWLTPEFRGVVQDMDTLQPAMWGSNTNTAQGIDKGIEVLLSSPAARADAAKVMVLLTDGLPNQTRATPTQYNTVQAAEDAIAAAHAAASSGVKIFVIGVGDATTDQTVSDWLAGLAQAGGGLSLSASGDTNVYHADLLNLVLQFGR